jgi:hypothetical protein
MAATLTWCKGLCSSWLRRRLEQVTPKAARNWRMDVWKRWQPVGRGEGTQWTSKGEVIHVLNQAPSVEAYRGVEYSVMQNLISKLEGEEGGGGWWSDAVPSCITPVSTAQEAVWAPQLGCRPYRHNKPLGNSGNRKPKFRSNRKLRTLIIRTLKWDYENKSMRTTSLGGMF